MTISRVTNSVQHEAAGNAGEKFNIPFKFFNNSEILLQEADVTQAQGTIYTLAGAGTDDGGTVTYVGTPTAAATIDIQRVLPLSQETEYGETGKFSAEATEDTFDRGVMLAQQSLTMDTTTGKTFDAKAGGSVNRKIVNVSDPTGDQDVATKAYVDSQTATAGNVPSPLSGDVGKHLEATGADTFAWAITEEVPTPAAADLGFTLEAQTAAVNGFDWLETPAAGGRANNVLINGGFRVSQHGTAFDSTTVPVNDDATYLIDRWILLSEANNSIDLSQETSVVPNGSYAACKLDVETANDKFGIVQILEARDTATILKNGNASVVSLSFKARTTTGATISNIRAAVIGWVGTADSPTTDVVDGANWNASGSNPDLAANWSSGGSSGYYNTPANLAVSVDSYTTHTIPDITVDDGASVNNLAVFIWSDDDATTLQDLLYIADVQLEVGTRANAYQHRPYAEELALCQRYLQVYVAGDADDPFCLGVNITDTTHSTFIMPLSAPMRTTPTLVVGSAASDFETFGKDGADTASAIVIATATPNAATLTVTHTAVTADVSLLLQAVNANAKLTFVAEL